jgi:hypothetical protein
MELQGFTKTNAASWLMIYDFFKKNIHRPRFLNSGYLKWSHNFATKKDGKVLQTHNQEHHKKRAREAF